MKARLALETGRVFEGNGFGAVGETAGEVVFCTALAGYQEIMTDPSYQGQIVVMTYPHIGNYGTTPDFNESKKPHVAGYVAREFSPMASHWKTVEPIDDYMKKNGVVGLDGIDTRALVRHLRDAGVCRGVISTETLSAAALVDRAKQQLSMSGADLVKEVTCSAAYPWTTAPAASAGGKKKVALLDFGAKFNIMNSLAGMGCEVTVFPARTSLADLLKTNPDGIMLSNGPGDPAAVTYAIDTIRALVSHNEKAKKPIPVFGICLGHQLLGLALGGRTFKLKFGHRGANHPVKDLTTGKVEVTTQNHGFAVDIDSLKGLPVELTHINLNDQTLEGLRHKTLPLFSVQYHPEAFPGPHDAHYLFDRFLGLMKKTETV
ncbi:MAG: glutamine-hydrolyzing carbamoyl-phosphate synthase small subunit [Elusimicrobia bacterium]|nr:glutamine-hydrolyzing carbamoyl-phosphate synthase small subunit [Elusimicrobiota bacterium]